MAPLDLWYTMKPIDPCTRRCSMSYMSNSSKPSVLCPIRLLLYTGRTCTNECILCHMSHIGLLLCTEYASTLEAISYGLCPMPPEFTSVAQIRASTQESHVSCLWIQTFTMSLHAQCTGEGHSRVSYVPCPSPLPIPHSGLPTGLTRSRRSPSSR